MTPTELNVLRAQMAAPISVANPGWTTAGVIKEVDALIAALGVTADEPAPADPAPAPEPDYRALLRDLVSAVQRHHPSLPHWSDEEKRRYSAARAAVRQ